MRSLSPPHGVNSNRKHQSCLGTEDQSTSIAWRPAYQPQLPQTTWGTLVAPHRGQRLREGRSRRQALAQRMRLLALEAFFLGTALASSSVRGWGGCAANQVDR